MDRRFLFFLFQRFGYFCHTVLYVHASFRNSLILYGVLRTGSVPGEIRVSTPSDGKSPWMMDVSIPKVLVGFDDGGSVAAVFSV